MSRRGHNQLSALKPLFGVACPLWWNKEVDARQHLHGLPQMTGWCVSDQNHILASSRPSHGISRRGKPRRYARQWDRTAVAAPSAIPSSSAASPYSGEKPVFAKAQSRKPLSRKLPTSVHNRDQSSRKPRSAELVSFCSLRQSVDPPRDGHVYPLHPA
jgi:hypothetical protein